MMMGGGEATSTTKRNENQPCFLAMWGKKKTNSQNNTTLEHNMLKLINFVIINNIKIRQACYALVSVELLSSLICYVSVLFLFICSPPYDIFLIMINF